MYVVDYSKDDQVLSFSTKKEAERFMHSRNFLYYESTATLEQSWYNRGIHVCSHGGFARPKYVVRRYKDGWGIKIIYYYYCGTLFAPKDRRCVKLDFDVIA